MTRNEIANTIEQCKENTYTEAQFSALPFDLVDGVERFWEPGYDYSNPDFWTSYPDIDAEFIKAVIRYDILKREAD